MIGLLEFIAETLSIISNKSFSADSVPEIDPSTSKPLKLPYITYHLPGSVVGEIREDFQLIIDIWGSSKKLESLEELASKVADKFKKMIYLSNDFLVRFYLVGRQQLPDEDRNISRRRLVFVAKTMFKSKKGE